MSKRLTIHVRFRVHGYKNVGGEKNDSCTTFLNSNESLSSSLIGQEAGRCPVGRHSSCNSSCYTNIVRANFWTPQAV